MVCSLSDKALEKEVKSHSQRENKLKGNYNIFFLKKVLKNSSEEKICALGSD